MQRSKTDVILGIGAMILYLLTVVGLLTLSYLLPGSLTVWRVLAILILAGLVSAPAVFALDDWLRKKWG